MASASSHSSFDWVKEIKPELKALDSIPLTGSAPPFPWEEFSSKLGTSINKELRIEPGELKWRSKEELYQELGDAQFPLNFAIPLFKGEISWVMPTQEIELLSTLLLTTDSSLSLHDPTLNQSFYRFLTLEVLYQLTQIPFDHVPILTENKALPERNSLTWDISIHLHDHTFWGRLIISPEFRQSWVDHFAKKPIPTQNSEKIAQIADIIAHVEAGKTHLSLKEFKQIHLGDVLLLDHCTLDPDNFEGKVLLTIKGRTVFRAKLKENTLKILALPLVHEVDTPMPTPTDDEDIDLNADDFENLDFLDDIEDENSLVEETTSPPAPAKEPKTVTTTQDTSPLKPEQIPITVVVEVGQIQMTIEQLLKLEPGNLLDISLNPENGVHLTINGKMVGKGELLRVGESLGVRVMELG